jgi:hypothetical protein
MKGNELILERLEYSSRKRFERGPQAAPRKRCVRAVKSRGPNRPETEASRKRGLGGAGVACELLLQEVVEELVGGLHE